MEHTEFRNALGAAASAATQAGVTDELPPLSPGEGVLRWFIQAEEINSDLTAGLDFGGWDGLTPDQKNSFLTRLLDEQDPGVPREIWLRSVAAAARSNAPDRRDICRKWSKRSPRFDPNKFETEFSSFERDHNGGITIGTLLHEASDALKNEIRAAHKTAPLFGSATPPTPVSSQGRTLAALLASGPLYKRKTDHEGDIAIGAVTIVNAPGGTAKTTYLVALSVALASNKPILGKRVNRAHRVLFVNFEEPDGELLLKFAAATRHHNIGQSAQSKIVVYGAGTLPNLTLTMADQRGITRLNEAGFATLEALVTANQATVVVLDSLSQLIPSGGNDNGVIYRAMTRLAAVGERLGCAIVVAAHTRKGGTLEADGAEAVLGAVATGNAARRVLGVRRPTAETCKAIGVPYGHERNIREIVDQKANYTSTSDSTFLEIIAVPMGNAQPPDYPDEDWVATMAPFTPAPGGRTLPPAGMLDALILLAAGTKGGAEPFSPAAQSKDRSCHADIAAALSPHLGAVDPAKLKQAAKDALAEAVTKGWVEVFDAQIGRNSRKGLRVVWSATPWASNPKPAGAYVL